MHQDSCGGLSIWEAAAVACCPVPGLTRQLGRPPRAQAQLPMGLHGLPGGAPEVTRAPQFRWPRLPSACSSWRGRNPEPGSWVCGPFASPSLPRGRPPVLGARSTACPPPARLFLQCGLRLPPAAPAASPVTHTRRFPNNVKPPGQSSLEANVCSGSSPDPTVGKATWLSQPQGELQSHPLLPPRPPPPLPGIVLLCRREVPGRSTSTRRTATTSWAGSASGWLRPAKRPSGSVA